MILIPIFTLSFLGLIFLALYLYGKKSNSSFLKYFGLIPLIFCAVPVFVLSLLLAIRLLAFSQYEMDRKVSIDELIGLWKLSQESLHYPAADGLKIKGDEAFTIEFKNNGECVFKSIESRNFKPVYIEAVGEWKLDHDLSENNSISICINNATSSGYSVYESKGGLILYRNWGDPDAGAMLEYIKQK